MTLLQAAIAFGFLMMIYFVIFMIVSTVIITKILKRKIFRENINDFAGWLFSICLAIAISLSLFYLQVLLFDVLFPKFLEYS